MSNKTPFTDDEMQRIYAACDSLRGPTSRDPGYRNWSGEDVKDFVMLSIYTGLRISDVATFDITRRLKGNDVFLRMHKTKRELYTWIPDWLVERLRARERVHGRLIFRTGESTVMRTMAELWRVKLAKVFKLAGPFDERPTLIGSATHSCAFFSKRECRYGAVKPDYITGEIAVVLFRDDRLSRSKRTPPMSRLSRAQLKRPLRPSAAWMCL